MKPKILGCIKWQNRAKGLHYCEYYDTRTGKFMAIGMATDQVQAERRAAQMLPSDVVNRIPKIAQVLEGAH